MSRQHEKVARPLNREMGHAGVSSIVDGRPIGGQITRERHGIEVGLAPYGKRGLCRRWCDGHSVDDVAGEEVTEMGDLVWLARPS